MVIILEALQYSYGWTLRGSPVFVWLNILRSTGFCVVGLIEPPGIRMVGLSETPWFSNGWTLRGRPVFVWLDS